MTWFKHRHYWRLQNVLALRCDGAEKGEMRIEQCRCGAVRSVEIYVGQAPIIRVTAPPSEDRPND